MTDFNPATTVILSETHVAVAFQPMSARRDRRAGGR